LGVVDFDLSSLGTFYLMLAVHELGMCWPACA
jgi:hypothetical protein